MERDKLADNFVLQHTLETFFLEKESTMRNDSEGVDFLMCEMRMNVEQKREEQE